MAHALEAFLDDAADAAVRGLWARLDEAGVPSSTAAQRPRVTFARAASIPARTRSLLRTEVGRLSLPELWFATLGTFGDSSLVLAAVVDTEVLALHTAIHDVLAGAVRTPSASHLPGSWSPHCVLAHDIDDATLVAGFAALHPVAPIRARLTSLGITDTRTGDVDLLLGHRPP